MTTFGDASNWLHFRSSRVVRLIELKQGNVKSQSIASWRSLDLSESVTRIGEGHNHVPVSVQAEFTPDI